MSIVYKSTRGNAPALSASRAVIKGLADDGGLFVPDRFPRFDFELSSLAGMDYKETAFSVMRLLLDDYSEGELKDCIDRAYDDKFDTEEIAPLVKKGDKYFLELFHGRTIAFKDMALSILPHLLTTALRKNGTDKKAVILTATSGDTGKAALSGFSGVPGTRIIVFYPKGGVSRIQELQMVTQKGSNTKVFGVKGNFDDCQSAVKAVFNDGALRKEMEEKGFIFSSANSINIGRLIPQIAYYVYAYGRMLKTGETKAGEKINFCVPTGNFGNILAAYYARQMGLPIGRFICASNENNVLYDFFKTGTYDRNRDFVITCSPSMDILISSNLERLIYHIAGDDPDVNARRLMNELNEHGKYSITDKMKAGLSDFYAAYATQEETFQAIRSLYEETGYVIDTHTATASHAETEFRKETDDRNKTVIVSTASPFKFARSVYCAINGETDIGDDFEITDLLSEQAKICIPSAVSEIRDADIVHDMICDPEGIKDAVRSCL